MSPGYATFDETIFSLIFSDGTHCLEWNKWWRWPWNLCMRCMSACVCIFSLYFVIVGKRWRRHVCKSSCFAGRLSYHLINMDSHGFFFRYCCCFVTLPPDLPDMSTVDKCVHICQHINIAPHKTMLIINDNHVIESSLAINM